ncbi:MAG: alkaline phosphatase family protein [Euryarchaeota archaeon]|nr:alkaline phosphatase family protein [Euryarchaeota archaeon]
MKPEIPIHLTLIALILLLPPASATTEITVHNPDYGGCVLLIIDGLGSSYCYPEFTPYALDNSTSGRANCTTLLAVAESGMRIIDVRAPVTSTAPGHSVIVTGHADATPGTVASSTTIFDIAHDNGYFCAGIMENGDFSEMCDELDVILHVKKNSINNPGVVVDRHPHNQLYEDVSIDIAGLMENRNNTTKYLGDKKGASRYIAYNRWAIDASDAVIQNLALNNVPFLLIINVGAIDSAGHHLGAPGYLNVINGTDEAVMKLYQTCANHNLLFILTADHGMSFATSGAVRGGHVSDKYAEHPESQRIPLIFSGIRILRGTIPSGGQEDIAPTLLYQMGLPWASCDGNPLPVEGYADLRVMAGPNADVEVRGCDNVVRGTSDSEFLFRGLNAGYNYTIRVTGDGRADEHEILLDSDCVVDCSAAGKTVVSVVAGPQDPTGKAQENGQKSILWVAVPIILINLVGMLLIIRIMRD